RMMEHPDDIGKTKDMVHPLKPYRGDRSSSHFLAKSDKPGGSLPNDLVPWRMVVVHMQRQTARTNQILLVLLFFSSVYNVFIFLQFIVVLPDRFHFPGIQIGRAHV